MKFLLWLLAPPWVFAVSAAIQFLLSNTPRGEWWSLPLMLATVPFLLGSGFVCLLFLLAAPLLQEGE